MKYKFQEGGENSMFNLLADYAMQQQFGQPEEDVQSEEAVPQDEENVPYTNEDYLELQDKYSQLEQRLNSLESSYGSYQGEDQFMNFIFNDAEDKTPINVDGFFGHKQIINTPPSAPQKALPSKNGFQTFGSYEEGRAALERQLQLYQTGKTKNPVKPSSTLLEAMSVYAPAADKNNPQHYAKFIADRLGVSVNTPISQIDTKGWADAIEKMEGNKTGNNPGNLRPYQVGGTSNTADSYGELKQLKHAVDIFNQRQRNSAPIYSIDFPSNPVGDFTIGKEGIHKLTEKPEMVKQYDELSSIKDDLPLDLETYIKNIGSKNNQKESLSIFDIISNLLQDKKSDSNGTRNLRPYQTGGTNPGYYFDFDQQKYVKGRYKTDVYFNSDLDRSQYDPTDNTIELGTDASSESLNHEKHHAEQNRHGEFSSYRSAPLNTDLLDLIKDTPQYNNLKYGRRNNDIEKLSSNFEKNFKKAYPDVLYTPDMMFVGKGSQKDFTEKTLQYSFDDTLEGQAENSTANPFEKDENVELRFKQYGGDDVSRQGYNFNSPYRNERELLINTPTGEITMENTRMPLLGIDNLGNKKIMKPGGKYKFEGTKVKEMPIEMPPMHYQAGGPNRSISEDTAKKNDYQTFYNDYMNSEEYAKRLLGQGYTDPAKTIADRKASVNKTGFSTTTGRSNSLNGNIEVNPQEGSVDEIAAHEYSHKGGSGPVDGNPNLTMTDAELQLFNGLNKAPKNSNDHIKNPYEAKADLDALRYLMKDFKKPNEIMTIEDLNKARSLPEIKKSVIDRRLKKRYKDEDILKLLNSVATNDNKINKYSV